MSTETRVELKQMKMKFKDTWGKENII